MPEQASQWIPLAVTLALVILGLTGLRQWLSRHQPSDADAQLPRQLVLIGAYLLGALLITISLPVSEATRGQLVSLAGLLITALIALSSTTLVANAMAGLLLRIVNSFRPGDYIRVGDFFGRVTERGLFHTEIQTEDRDLMTLPNMHLITTPVTVVHEAGTIVSATLSLGYDLHHERMIELLKSAADKAGLSDPFVHIRELGDFSIVYRVSGRLEDLSSLLTTRSNLRGSILDTLHGSGIEIVSPSFMAQRPQSEGSKMIPALNRRKPSGSQDKAEDMIFDKAEQAGQKQARLARIDEIRKQLNDKSQDLSPDQTTALEAEVAELEALSALEDAPDAARP